VIIFKKNRTGHGGDAECSEGEEGERRMGRRYFPPQWTEIMESTTEDENDFCAYFYLKTHLW